MAQMKVELVVLQNARAIVARARFGRLLAI